MQQDNTCSDAESNAELTGVSEVPKSGELPKSSKVSSDANKLGMAEHEPPSVIPPPDHYCFFFNEALLRLWYEC